MILAYSCQQRCWIFWKNMVNSAALREVTNKTWASSKPGVSSHQIRCNIGYRPSKVRNLKPVGCWSKSCGNPRPHGGSQSASLSEWGFPKVQGYPVYHPVVNQLIPPSQLRRGWPPLDPHTVESQRPSYSSSARFPLAWGLRTHVFFPSKNSDWTRKVWV